MHVASLNRVKDQGTLLRALRVLADRGRDFHLDVIGEDTLGGETQALAAELGVAERIRFHGFLPQREVRRVVEAAHVAVVSSRHEAGPLVVLEAAAAGVPTVGTAVGHIAEWSPQAAIAVPCLDPFHVVQWATKALDEVRRSTWNKLRETGRPDLAHTLKHARWALWKNPDNLTAAQASSLAAIQRDNATLYLAYGFHSHAPLIALAMLCPPLSRMK